MERLYGVADGALQSAGLNAKQLVGIGVGAAGQVDAAEGVLVGTPNLSQAVVDLPIAASLRKRYGVPAALRNDVQVAAAGEMAFGAGRGLDDVVFCFVGTGVGGAVVSGGKSDWRQRQRGEIGHIVVDSGGRRLCGCGGRGHLESYASRTAITFSLMGDLKRGRESVLRELAPELMTSAMWPESGAVRSRCLTRRARAGRPARHRNNVTEAGRYLGYGLASVINFQPIAYRPRRRCHRVGRAHVRRRRSSMHAAKHWPRRRAAVEFQPRRAGRSCRRGRGGDPGLSGGRVTPVRGGWRHGRVIN